MNTSMINFDFIHQKKFIRFFFLFLIWGINCVIAQQGIIATTNAATNVTSNSATLNGMVNPNSLTLTVNAYFQYGKTTGYGDVTPVISVPSGMNSVAVKANITGLEANTTYNFRICAVYSNGTGTECVGNLTFITAAVSPSAPTVTANAETNVGKNSATLNATVKANGAVTTVRFNYGTTTAYGMSTQISVAENFNEPVSAPINNLLPNTIYHYQVVATNSVGNASSGNQCFRTFPDQTITLAHTVNFPSQPAQSDYKIVGIPGGNNSFSIKNFLSGAQGKDWEAYRDDGEDDFIKFSDNDPLFKLGGGRAFWVISKRNMALNGTSSAVIPSAGTASITLDNKGWNLITNPFDFNIAWQTIQNANSATQPLYTYDKGLKTSRCLEPYIGYYFYNFGNAGAQLKIPYVPSCSDCPETDAQTTWRIKVALTSGEFGDHTNSFGVAPEASQALDPLDWRKPRALAEMPTVSFSRPAWDAQYSIFATDIRPAFEGSQSWDFDVRALPHVGSQLAFTGLAKVPRHFAIFLIDESKARAVNLREDSLYRFTPATALAKFTVVVGAKETVQDQLRRLALPQSFTLGPNYPNPFNRSTERSRRSPETMIPVSVSAASIVRLQIYNALGQVVRTLHNGALEAGTYWFSWNGRDEADREAVTGVYLYRLTTNTNVGLTQKMILLR